LGIGQYWSVLGWIGYWAIFFDCEIQYRYPLTQYKWSPPAAVCCLSQDQTAAGGGRRPPCNDSYLDLLANNGGGKSAWKSGAGEGGSTLVERLAFMTDWKDYWVSALHSMPSHTVSHNRRTTDI